MADLQDTVIVYTGKKTLAGGRPATLTLSDGRLTLTESDGSTRAIDAPVNECNVTVPAGGFLGQVHVEHGGRSEKLTFARGSFMSGLQAIGQARRWRKAL